MLRLLNRAPLRRRCRLSLTTRNASTCLQPRLLTQSVIRYDFCQRRGFVDIPTLLLPPVVFAGLVAALWTWKCLMMVIFQNKIIYMPGLPPNARRETIVGYKNQCRGVEWREERIRSLDGTRISLCLASGESGAVNDLSKKTLYILYFQGHYSLSVANFHPLTTVGNASSLPPRLPSLSSILRLLRQRAINAGLDVEYTMVCCSYRGYWTSSGRATEKGIALDAAAALGWIEQYHSKQSGTIGADIPVIVWGQSIGAGVAAELASKRKLFSDGLSLSALILETPFLSIRAMLETLYPQKWLPYRYLWPFLRNHLDSEKALGVMHSKFGDRAPSVLILEAGKDELVPSSHGQLLEERCQILGLKVEKKVIYGALHTEVLVRQEGISSVVNAIEDVGRSLPGP